MQLDLDLILYICLIGVTEGMYLWLVAAGLSLVFGVLRVVNFAHGAFYMFGGYIAFSWLSIAGLNFWVGLFIAPLGLALIGLVIERFFLRGVYHLDLAFQILLTFGFILILDDLVKLIWGPVYQTSPMPSLLQGLVQIFSLGFPIYNFFIIGAGCFIGFGLWLLFERTKWGLIVQATVENRDMANALGVKVPYVFTGVFIFGAWLAGIAGYLSVPIRALSPGMGELIIIEAFVVVVIGGLGSLKGAFIGAMLIGLLHAFGTMFLPIFELAIAYIVMAGVLIFRPWGLFGVREI